MGGTQLRRISNLLSPWPPYLAFRAIHHQIQHSAKPATQFTSSTTTSAGMFQFGQQQSRACFFRYLFNGHCPPCLVEELCQSNTKGKEEIGHSLCSKLITSSELATVAQPALQIALASRACGDRRI